MTPLNTALAALRQEKAQLERMLGRVNSAIEALTDEPSTSRATKKRRKRKRKPMSAAAKLAVSERMREYWASRKK